MTIYADMQANRAAEGRSFVQAYRDDAARKGGAKRTVNTAVQICEPATPNPYKVKAVVTVAKEVLDKENFEALATGLKETLKGKFPAAEITTIFK